MSKHTHGPWKPEWVVGDMEVVKCGADGSITPICGVYHPTRGSKPDCIPCQEEAFENARLIASAPALLEALKALLIQVEQTAEDNGPCDHGNGLCICDLHRDINAARAAIAAAEGTAP